jgi:hypothetical protein
MNQYAPRFHIAKSGNEFLYIVDDYSDRRPTKTITNGVEEVLLELLKEGKLRQKKLFYKDTDGNIDQILYNTMGAFVDFRPVSDETKSVYGLK